jgi:hypothetical protein
MKKRSRLNPVRDSVMELGGEPAVEHSYHCEQQMEALQGGSAAPSGDAEQVRLRRLN